MRHSHPHRLVGKLVIVRELRDRPVRDERRSQREGDGRGRWTGQVFKIRSQM